MVVGAGACGLTTALALARAGYSICLVEARRDPTLPDAATELAAARVWLDRANDTSKGPMAAEYHAAARIRNRYWGTYERNVSLDGHSLAYLESLGVDTGGLPKPTRIDLNGLPDGPRFHATLRQRVVQPEAAGLSAERALLQRDWAAQPSLGDLERLLLERIRRCDHIEIRFGSTAHAIDASPQGIIINTKTGALTAGIVIVADGGGVRSLSRQLVSRTIHHRERINLAVAQSDATVTLFGHPTTDVFAHNTLTEDGWLGIFCSGHTVSAVVNAVGLNSGTVRTAVQALNELGLRTRLVEPPIDITVEIAEADDVLPESRIVLVGDAALCGNPRNGLGVQFGLLWAQLVAASISRDRCGISLDERIYRSRAADIIRRRRTFELAWMEIVNRAITDPNQLQRYIVSEPALRSIRKLSVRFRPSRRRMRYRIKLTIDARRIPASDTGVIATFLRQFERVCIRANLRLRHVRDRDFTVKTRFDPKHRLDLSFGDECLSLRSGTLTFARTDDGWLVRIESAVALQTSRGRFASDFPIERMQIDLPDDFLDVAIAHAVAQPDRFAGIPLQARVRCLDRKVRWGPLTLHLRDRPQLRLELCASVLDVTVERGVIELLSITQFAHQVPLGGTRWLRNASRFWRGSLDPLIDRTVALASATVYRITVRPTSDNTALVSLYGALPISIRLSARDAARLRSELVYSALIGQLLSDHGECIAGLTART